MITAVASACGPHRTGVVTDPAGAHRFEITRVADSTFDFAIVGQRWVRVGTVGIAVDPRRRDALVARFLVSRVEGDTAEAVVTGQTTRVTDAHVALLDRPRVGPARRPSFWAGFFGGAALGAAIAIVTR